MNKFLTLIHTVARKETLIKYEEQWSKIRDPIRSKSNISHNDDEIYVKIKFNLDETRTI